MWLTKGLVVIPMLFAISLWFWYLVYLPKKITTIVRSIWNLNPSTSPHALDSKNQYVLALSPEFVRPMKDIRAAVDEKAQWRHSGLLLLNKVKCLDTLENLDTMFADSIAGLQLVGHHLMIQHNKITSGGVVDPQSMRFQITLLQCC
ncbi:hypothetical protein KCU71_g17345, partial [Aureobasidium melanogenum]